MFFDMELEQKIVTLLENCCGCTVVMANQTSPMPEYPYISYTITTPVHTVGGTYCFRDGVYYQPMLQTWSFTVQSDDYRNCLETGMKMYDFFACAGRTQLYESGAAVSSITNLMNRDNYLTIQYEYRCGMDVVFRVMHQAEIQEEKIKTEIMGVRIHDTERN